MESIDYYMNAIERATIVEALQAALAAAMYTRNAARQAQSKIIVAQLEVKISRINSVLEQFT